jgi:hypothetical protein
VTSSKTLSTCSSSAVEACRNLVLRYLRPGIGGWRQVLLLLRKKACRRRTTTVIFNCSDSDPSARPCDSGNRSWSCSHLRGDFSRGASAARGGRVWAIGLVAFPTSYRASPTCPCRRSTVLTKIPCIVRDRACRSSDNRVFTCCSADSVSRVSSSLAGHNFVSDRGYLDNGRSALDSDQHRKQPRDPFRRSNGYRHRAGS